MEPTSPRAFSCPLCARGLITFVDSTNFNGYGPGPESSQLSGEGNVHGKTNTNTVGRGGTHIPHILRERHGGTLDLHVISSECQCCLILVSQKLYYSHEVLGILLSSSLGNLWLQY